MKFSTSMLLLFLLSVPFYAATSSGAGSTGAAFLEIGVGARWAAMGEAGVAWADDVYGMYFNPAGIADVRRSEVGFTHNTLFLDLDYNYIGYVHPLRVGTLGFAGTYVDLGSVDRREVGAGGDPTASLGSATGHDLAFSVSYARAVSRAVDLGASVKIISENLDQHTAAALAVDLGARWRPPVPGLSIGLSLSNLGTSLEFIREKDELPITLRAGAGWKSPSGRWGLLGDLVWVKNQDIEGKIGGEYWVLADRLVLRAGANSANDIGNGLTVGAGFRWNDILFDYGYVPVGDLGSQHNVSLAYRFGPVRDEPILVERRAEPVRRTEPLRVEPSVAPSIRRGIVASPFVYRSGEPGHEWISAATAEVLHADWRKSGAVGNYSIDGDYWVIGEALVFAAKITSNDPARPGVWRTSVTGNLAAPFIVWQELRLKINQVLAAQGVMGLNLRPAPATQQAPPPPPVVVREPVLPPPPAAGRRPSEGRGVTVSIRQYGVDGRTPASVELTAAVERSLRDLGLATDAAGSQYRLEAQFAELEDGTTVFSGRIIDRATGIPLGNVEVYGTLSDIPGFAARIADAVYFKLPR